MHDYIIIGGGPTGLTLAYLLSKYNKKILLIEKDQYLGGCHAVKRVNGLFTEHGPRIYINNYLMFTELLKDMGYNFYELFTKYNFTINTMAKEVLKVLSFRELLILSWGFINLNDSYKEISLLEYLKYHNFSEKSIDLLDRIGRLTDGGSADKYTFYSFMQILNQNFLYDIYQPKKPNDEGFIKIWENSLIKNGVDILKNTEIEEFNILDNKIDNIKVNGKIIYSKKIIMACAPKAIYNILKKYNFKDAFGKNFNNFQKETEYLPYISVIFHWKDIINVPKIWGYPRTSWGVGNIVMSDYMNFNDPRSKTVISAIITMTDKKSEYLNKTPDEIKDKNIIIKEVFRQLKQIYKDLPDPDYYLLTQNYYDNNLEKWVPLNNAFITTKYGFINYESEIYENLYNCGVHNGNSSYSFTSLESSIVNAIKLVHKLEPQTQFFFKIKEASTLRYYIFLIFIIILILLIIFWSRQSG